MKVIIVFLYICCSRQTVVSQFLRCDIPSFGDTDTIWHTPLKETVFLLLENKHIYQHWLAGSDLGTSEPPSIHYTPQ